MRIAALAIIALLYAAPVSAQSRTLIFDFAQLGYGPVQAQTVETDGEPLTIEVLLWVFQEEAYRVVAIRPSASPDGLCRSEPFYPGGLAPSFAARQPLTVKRIGRTDWLTVDTDASVFGLSIDTPPCNVLEPKQ